MEEHPGDTLGRRFITWWGVVLAILVCGAALYGLRCLLGPKSADDLDGGLASARLEKRALVEKEQVAELTKYEKDAAKGTVRIPPADAIPYAASVLSQQKAKPGPYLPGMAPAPAAGAHDPNQSKFEGK